MDESEFDKINNTENNWFSGFVLLGSGIGSLFFFINANSWLKVKNEQLNNPNKPKFKDINPDSLYLINAFMGVIFLAIFVWAIIRIFMGAQKQSNKLKTNELNDLEYLIIDA